jgi:Tetratricopeptide repeat
LWYRKSIELNRNFFLAHCLLAAALANLGKQEEAWVAAKTALALNPNVTIVLLRRVISAATDNPAVLAQAERIFVGRRKAGVPEG